MVSQGVFFSFFLPKMKNNNCIRRMPYLSNSIAYDHDFWYVCVKRWYPGIFFIILKFSFFGLLVWWGRGGRRGELGMAKGKSITQNKNKNCIRHTPCLRKSIAYDQDFWYTWVKWCIEVLFSLFRNFHFLGC